MMSVPFFHRRRKNFLAAFTVFLKESRDKLIASLNDFPSPQLSDNLKRIYDAVLSTTLFMSPGELFTAFSQNCPFTLRTHSSAIEKLKRNLLNGRRNV